MKRRLNILCVLVILVLGYSLYNYGYQYGVAISSGVKTGLEVKHKPEAHKERMDKLKDMKPIALLPDNMMNFTDSVYNEKTGSYAPAMYSQLIVSVKAKETVWQTFVWYTASYFNIFVVIFAIVMFIKLIISINKSNIFNWKNVRRLRLLGSALVISFICSAIPIWVSMNQLGDSFAIKGYSLNLSEFISSTNLVLGIAALIVGEVFAIGLRMKEEQDLTI